VDARCSPLTGKLHSRRRPATALQSTRTASAHRAFCIGLPGGPSLHTSSHPPSARWTAPAASSQAVSLGTARLDYVRSTRVMPAHRLQ
jgi:hypothetical protein